MNLPGFAINFIPNFRGILLEEEFDLVKETLKFWIHCYTFVNSENDGWLGEAKEVFNKFFDHPLDDIRIHHVRSVSPNKEMICASFQPPIDFLTSLSTLSTKEISQEQPPSKKIKLL